jgi:hypothetical protein
MGEPHSDARRRHLRAALEQMGHLAARLGGDGVCEAVAVCLAILDAPGSLDRATLAPALQTLFECLSRMFHAGAGEVQGPLGDRLAEQSRQAGQDARDLGELIRKLGLTSN